MDLTTLPRLKLLRDFGDDWTIEKEYLCWNKEIAKEQGLQSPFSCSITWVCSGYVMVYFYSNHPVYGSRLYKTSRMTKINSVSVAPPKPEPDHPLVAFYKGHTIVHPSGLSIYSILEWGHGELEHTHDYIQWCFPTSQASEFNPDAPVLTPDVIKSFKTNLEIRGRLYEMFTKMMEWYGLCGYSLHTHWLTPDNHNYLRLTRIVTCMRELGFDVEALALRAELLQIAVDNKDVVSAATASFWRWSI